MRYRLLGRTGLKVSELCLGTMTFGEESGFGADRDECRRVYDAYRAAVAREAADPVTAVAAWRAVLARWPDGALAEAAALRLIALHGRLGQRAPQQAAARAFLARHPRSARAADVARLLEAP